MRLNGKLAVVSAAASGMGRAGCERFVAEGAAIAAIDINEDAVNEMVESIRSSGGTAFPVVADLSDKSECERAIREAAQHLGGINVLWNHAGIPGPSGIEKIDYKAYDQTIRLNVDSCVVMSSAAIPIMRDGGGGSMLFTASTSGLVGSMFSPIYSATKFAVVGLAKSLAVRLAPDNIRVNALCPALTETPMLRGFTSRNGSDEEHGANLAKIRQAVPLGRPGTATEMANAALWLLSDEASYVTGIALPVDGGFTAS